MGLVLGSILTLVFFVFGIGILGTIFWIWMLIDAIQRDFKNSNEKIVWLLVIFFTHILGSVIYFFVIRNNNPSGVAKKFK